MPEALPRQIGRYQAVRMIGRGGAGTVYLGFDAEINRTVAIKVLHVQGDQAAERRFLHEARAAGSLTHANIATIYDFGRTSDGEIFIIQEFISGESLKDVVSRHPSGIAPPIATRVLQQVAQALAYAHGQGVEHRDIKPANVALLEDGTAKLLDFGIARVVNAPSNVTRVGEMIGTPAYLPPEAIRGQGTDFRSDIYSFGALGFELLTGRKPYVDESVAGLVGQILHGPPVALQPLVPDCPEALVTLTESCLAREPGERPQTMSEVANILSSLPSAWDSNLIRSKPSSPDDAEAVGLDTTPTVDRRQADPDGTGGGTVPLDSTVFPPGTRVGDLTGQKVNRFVLHERLSQGHSGDLYKSWDPVRGELVCVKIVRAQDADARTRLLRGGRLWLKLNHPHVIRVLEVHPDHADQPGLIVSQLINGENLEEFAAQRYLTLNQVVWIVMQVCDALAEIHRRGVVHREVKPRNIMVSGDDLHVTLLDSGIARHANPEVDAFTKTGIFVGDLAYAAPEQSAGRVDQRTDVYSAVAVLYELVTRSKLPFPPPADWHPDPELLGSTPTALRSIFERGLRSEPNSRFASIRELHDQLRVLAPDRKTITKGRSVIALHGIRTQAAWQRAFSEVAGSAGLSARVDRWNFGYFSAIRFLLPWARLAKVRWFRETYQQEFHESVIADRGEHPSIVAHSFGTYILGNALIRYPYLRFNKVLLCGSVLPRSFPWDRLIERGQVQAVRNEFGSEDIWTRAVGWFIPSTGPSGLTGFTVKHSRLQEEPFTFAHSEYFERGHMNNRWLPYLTAEISQLPAQEIEIAPPEADFRPWGLYTLYALLIVGLSVAAVAVF